MTATTMEPGTRGGATTDRRHPRSRLHPAKIIAGLRRRWFEHQMERTPLRETAGLLMLGNPDYGGWIVPGRLIDPGWICYSVGAGGDTNFDMDLIQRYDVKVRSIDPVPEYVELAIEHARGDRRLTAHRAAIATEDGPMRMQLTHDPGSQSVSPAGLYDTHSYIELPGRTLKSLMAELGDTRIDLLKLDIEGGEYAVIPTLDLNALGVKVFATQLHHTGTVRDARRLVAILADQGYDPVACHPAVKITFARRDLT
jgi:FkbM family methyltransferase